MKPIDEAWQILKEMTLYDQGSDDAMDPRTGRPSQVSMDAKYGVPKLNMFHQAALARMQAGEAPVLADGKTQFDDAIAAQQELARRQEAVNQYDPSALGPGPDFFFEEGGTY